MPDRPSALQGVLNHVLRGLESQGWQRSEGLSEAGITACVYRGDEGRKCAAGHCIPDRAYRKSIESLGVRRLKTLGVPLLRRKEVLDLLDHLQSWHDDHLYIGDPWHLPNLMDELEGLLSSWITRGQLAIPDWVLPSLKAQTKRNALGEA